METPMNFNQLILVAFLIEALIQTIKPIYDKDLGWDIDKLISIAVGIIVCLVTGVDLFKTLGFDLQMPVIGQVMTGIIASRGSNFVHNIFKFMQGKAQSQNREPEAYG